VIDLANLSKSDAVYARVMLRYRQRAWDFLYWLQDLKPGDTVMFEGKVSIVEQTLEREVPADVTIKLKDNPCSFIFSVSYAEKGCHSLFMRGINRNNQPAHLNYRDAYRDLRPTAEMANVLYSETK
jgi:hypothetical protein